MSTKLYAGVAAAVLVAMIGGTAVWTTVAGSGHNCDGSTSIATGAASIGGPFELVNGAGQTVTDADVISEPSLVYFGYTFCPDICPFDVARNVIAVDILKEQGVEVTPVFITIDPQRDTPEVIASYEADMHPDMIGLTGSDEQIRDAAAAYRAFYSRGDGEGDFYLMNHSTFTYLMLPETGFATFFRRDLTPEAMAEQTACHIAAA
ncbi:MAG: SCO family protein [Bacteroidota bacterium]